LGIITHLQGRYDTAFTLLQQGLALATDAKDSIILSDILYNLAWMERIRGDYASARTLLNQAVAQVHEFAATIKLEDGDYICESHELGMIVLGEHDFQTARRLIQSGLRIATADYQYWSIANSLECLALVAAEEEQCQRAFTLAGAAAVLRRTTQSAPYSHTAAHLSAALTSLNDKYSKQEALAAQAMGERMTLDEAIAYACAQS
jgi:tetratricopeptide (TPR) repeat protein